MKIRRNLKQGAHQASEAVTKCSIPTADPTLAVNLLGIHAVFFLLVATHGYLFTPALFELVYI